VLTEQRIAELVPLSPLRELILQAVSKEAMKEAMTICWKVDRPGICAIGACA
jgi:hypothetical protein